MARRVEGDERRDEGEERADEEGHGAPVAECAAEQVADGDADSEE